MKKSILLVCLLMLSASHFVFAQENQLDTLKFEALRQYRIETKLKDSYLNQVMWQMQEANAAIIPDTLSNVMRGFPREFMRQTKFGNIPQKTDNQKERADYKGRYKETFRRESHLQPDYKQDLRANGYE